MVSQIYLLLSQIIVHDQTEHIILYSVSVEILST